MKIGLLFTAALVLCMTLPGDTAYRKKTCRPCPKHKCRKIKKTSSIKSLGSLGESTGNFLESIKATGKISGSDCYNLGKDRGSSNTTLKGCPESIPITLDGKIVAGRGYFGSGNDLPELSCNGECGIAFAETKITDKAGHFVKFFNSVIINPGCTFHIFQKINYEGEYISYSGPLLIPNFKIDGPSMIWTCKQTLPTCVPSDAWHEVTELNNAASAIPAKFSYKKTVGTTFSHSMQKSMEVSETVELAISASFWGITASIKSKTGFKWSKVTTDTETTSKAQSYTVEVEVPARKTVRIEEAMGTCGESKIYTQMFRVLDSPSDKVVAKYQGKIANYIIADYP